MVSGVLLRTVGAYLGSCLGLDLLLQGNANEEKNSADNNDLQQPQPQGLMGNLPPSIRGDEQRSPQEENQAVNSDLQPEDGCLLPSSGDEEEGQQLPPQRGDAAAMEYAENGDVQPIKIGHQEDLGTILPPITRGDYQKLAEDDDDLQMQQPHVGHNKTKQEADEEDLHENNKGSDPWLMALHTNCFFNEAIDKQRDSNSPAITTINLQILIFTNVQEPGQKFGEAYSWEMPTRTPRPRVKMKIGIRVDHMDAHSWEHDGWASSDPTLHHQKLMHATKNEVLDNTSLSFSLHILRGSVHQQDYVKKDEVKIHGAAALKAKTKRRMTPMRLYYLNKDLLDPG